ncbi:MAG TPA: hypothetical protein VGR98_24300 [Streptosporangiaceae bacterium]|nr:hypothetical protein [Streptosporangiaceae bacterium]
MTDPKSRSVMLDRSNSLVAQAYISSSVLGGRPASNRPSALAGAWLHATSPAIPVTTSLPCTSFRCVISRSGSV